MSETLPNNKKQVPRQLRERKQRKLYSDEWALGDDEMEGGRGFSLADKLESPRFEHAGAVLEMNGADLTVAYLQKNGFTTPLLFKEKTGLGLRVPTNNFSVNDVRMCVGSRRLLDVMDVNTQKNIEMTMKDWQRYYDDPNKERLLNVISLEFSHTRLENYVQPPRIVRLIDWVEVVWPRHLKDQQTESTNALDDMMYPKVQKYCLMSVKGCYTDFHIDFGGTSVWYHILRGAKVFWLIPPTEKNLQLYEKWVLSGKQSDVFFGDTVEKCIRVHLQAGHTFFIPTGWIHAVYTPSDSLVFGGNFLHPFGIEKQLKIAQVEDVTKVPQKFRYPFFTEMLWYVLERYVCALLGRTHLVAEGQPVPPPPPPPPPKEHVHLTQNELHGLKAIVMYLHQLPGSRKAVPELLSDPIALVRDVRTLVEQHRHDKQHLAVTGVPVLKGPEEPAGGERRGSSGRGGRGGAHRSGPSRPRPEHANSAPRRRRTRCKKCEACQRTDCGECVFCHDMVKFGGLGRAKQTCIMRQCLQPMLPVTASCAVCHLDGWMQTPVAPQAKGNSGRGGPSSLRECSVCYSIVHPACVPPGGQLNEDLPNSWECPTCTTMGLNHDYKPRHFRARQKSSDLRRVSAGSDASALGPHHNAQNKLPPPLPVTVKSEPASDHEGKTDASHIKTEDEIKHEEESAEAGAGAGVGVVAGAGAGGGGGAGGESWEPAAKKRRSSEDEEAPKKQALRAHLAAQITHHSTKTLKKPLYPVRPAPGAAAARGDAVRVRAPHAPRARHLRARVQDLGGVLDGPVAVAQHVVRAGARVGRAAGGHRAPPAAVAGARVVPAGAPPARLVAGAAAVAALAVAGRVAGGGGAGAALGDVPAADHARPVVRALARRRQAARRAGAARGQPAGRRRRRRRGAVAPRRAAGAAAARHRHHRCRHEIRRAGAAQAVRAGRVVVRAADGRGRGAAGAPRAAAAVAGGLPAAHRGGARPPRALPQPRQTGLAARHAGVDAGGDQVRRQVEAQPAREGREAGGVAQDLMRRGRRQGAPRAHVSRWDTVVRTTSRLYEQTPCHHL